MAMTKKNKDKYTEEAEARYRSQYEKDKKTTNQLYDRQVKSTNNSYDTQVFEQGRAYEDQFRNNAVQKEINKRQVAESMANLGLRDSGLNRTQQTAVQLSYGNNKANIERQRQAGIDSLEHSRRQALDNIEQNRMVSQTEIDRTFDNNVINYAERLREKDEVAAENKKTEYKNIVLGYLEVGAEPPQDIVALSGMTASEIKAYKNLAAGSTKETKKEEYKNIVLGYLEIGAEPPKNIVAASGMTSSELNAYKGYYKKTLVTKNKSTVTKNKSTGAKGNDEPKYSVFSFGGSSTDDEGNTVYYVYDKNGKRREYPQGINPYTNQPITGGYTTEDLKKVGVWNGYQPKAVKDNGVLLKIHQYAPNGTPIQVPHQGHYKRIWQTDDGRLWIWDDYVGNYVPAQDDDIK